MFGAGAARSRSVGAALGGALAVGVTVVTVSGGSDAAGGGADVVATGGADVVAAGWLVVTRRGDGGRHRTAVAAAEDDHRADHRDEQNRACDAGDPDPAAIDRLVVLLDILVVVVLLEALVFVVALAVEVDGFAAVVPVAGNPFGRAQGIR